MMQDPNSIHSYYEGTMKNIISRITLLTLFTAAVVFSQPEPGQRVMKDLNLTDAQQEQFQKVRFETQKKQIELNAKTETARLELARLFDAEQIDKSAIEKKMTELAGYQVAIRMNRLNAWSEQNKQLNPDQQKLWKKMLKQHLQKMNKQGKGMMMMRERMMNNNMPGHKMRMRESDEEMPERMERRIEKKIIKE
jgi:Spy/CpxP family protein refolding chaperone